MVLGTQNTLSDPPAALPALIGPRLSWAAVFAGTSLFIALSWLLMLLGAALGAGIADATDLAAMGDGLGIASIIWLILSSLVATFAGALLAGKLAGSADDRVGVLHGITVWSVGTILLIWIGVSGSGAAVNAISGAVSSATQASSTLINKVSVESEDESDLLPDAVTTSIAAVLKRQASQIVTATASGSEQPNRSEVRKAFESLNADDTGAIANALISGDTEKARSELADRTNLSDAQIGSVIRGAEQKASQWTESGSEQLEQAETWLAQQMRDVRRSASELVSDVAGSEVSARSMNRALRQLDPDTLAQAAEYLVMGQPESAKDVLVANTNLSEADIEAIVDGTAERVERIVDEATAELEEASETVGTYTQAVLWTAFIAAALGLAAGLFGGQVGAGTVRRLYVKR